MRSLWMKVVGGLVFCGVVSAYAGGQDPRPNATVREELRNEPLMMGTAWYPEQWPESRWDADLQLMEAAHMNVVRIGEFAWSTMELSEGQYEFGWLDRAIAMAAKHHIRVVLGTPTAAPPAWLTQKYPETLRVDEDGVRAEHGNRQQFSFTDATYRRFAARIATQMAMHYGHNPNVLGWQIDNELAAPSFDVSAKRAFHAWLKAKYGNVNALNRRWATAYWSQTYDSFDEVPVHSKNENPALLLDWKRFVTDTWVAYVDNQVAAMRPYLDGREWITTNTMHWFQGFDHYRIHQALDLAAWDDYVSDGHLDPVRNAVQHDLVRGYKNQNFWVMETQPAFVNWGAVNVALPRGVTREMAWQAIGHGADAVLYWQWRPAPNGQEEYHGSVLGADGTPVPVYDEIRKLGSEMATARAALQGTSVRADVAVLQDYDSHWAIDFQKHTNKFDYEQQITDLYRALHPQGSVGASAIDLIAADADLSTYAMVFAPAMNVLPRSTAEKWLAYVSNGGLLILGPRTGMKNEDNGLQTNGQPGPLVDALGAKVAQYYALDAPVEVHGADVTGKANVWAEELTPTAADTHVLMSYGDGNSWLKDKPAVVERSVGRGKIVYVGATLDVAALSGLLAPLLKEKGVAPLIPDLPEEVEVMERSSGARRIWIVENHGEKPQHVELGHVMFDVLADGAKETVVDIAGHGVAVLSNEATR
jgi:beta-galactosidase